MSRVPKDTPGHIIAQVDQKWVKEFLERVRGIQPMQHAACVR
jgi:hypothetical protein